MPRLPPSLTTPESRYSVPPNPDLASHMLVGSAFDHFCSLEQQAWSLTIQSILRSSTASHSASTSSRGRIGGLTLAWAAQFPSGSRKKGPPPTPPRNAKVGKTCCLVHPAPTPLRPPPCKKIE